ncbi:MAG: cytidylate kinase, partial [Dehalococcoidia bacterium]|nr:cytidylate kinase [Dehalococcoidia bacterium]
VLDAHLGFHFVPDSIRICLICDLEEAARRILDDSGRTTETATNIKDSIVSSQKRRDTMHENFMSLYQVDIDDHSNFDVVLDTTSLSSAEVFERASAFIDLQRA